MVAYASLAQRALESVADARRRAAEKLAREMREADIETRKHAALALQTRFDVQVSPDAFLGPEHGEYDVLVDGELRFIYHTARRTVQLIRLHDACLHEWRSTNLLTVRDLGHALERFEDERERCPACQHAE